LHEHRKSLNFLFFGPRLTAFIENSLAKSGIFSGDPTKSVSRVFASRSLLWLARGFRRSGY